jgi:hypothetical protein
MCDRNVTSYLQGECTLVAIFRRNIRVALMDTLLAGNLPMRPARNAFRLLFRNYTAGVPF